MRERVRTSRSGATRSRVTVDISGESIGIGLDPRAYGAPVAQAIADLFRERIRMIAETVSPATKRAREAAAKAFAAGKSWAVKRYAGGKLGAKAPNQSDRKFNDSGRMADSIVATAREGEKDFVINMAANRLNPETVNGGMAGLEKIWAELVRLVPELGNPRLLMDNVKVRRSVNEAVNENVFKTASDRVDRVRQLVQARMAFARSALSLVA